jgi:hypothetical protein
MTGESRRTLGYGLLALALGIAVLMLVWAWQQRRASRRRGTWVATDVRAWQHRSPRSGRISCPVRSERSPPSKRSRVNSAFSKRIVCSGTS